MAKRQKRAIALGPLESDVMNVVWDRGAVTAEEVREVLSASRQLKDSTVRTVLRRLEAKGVLTHSVQGRTFIYSAPVKPMRLALEAVRSIAARFCSGSVSKLLLGMVDDKLVSPDQLRTLADKIEKQRSHPGD